MRESVAEILPKLRNVREVKGGFMAQCPAHDDKHASLSINETDTGIIIYCHAGCSFEKITGVLGLKGKKEYKPREIVAIYDYYDEAYNLIYQVVRFEPKEFRHRRPDPDKDGEWIWDRKGIKPLLYNLPTLMDAIGVGAQVFIVEGEKDCNTLAKHGLVATTCSGGAKGWLPEFAELFQGAQVIILPDNDEAGNEYATQIAGYLYGWAKSLKLIKLDLSPGGDVTDYLNDNRFNTETLMNRVEQAQEYIPKGAVTREEFNNLKGHLIYMHKEMITMQKPSYRRPIYKAKQYTIKD